MKPKIKPSASIICFLLLIGSIISCEKPENEEENDIISTRPVLREGISSSINTFNNNEFIQFNNPFSGLKLNNPDALALVEQRTIQSKKSLNGEDNQYQIYEITNDSIKLVKGSEGNDIYLKSIDEIFDINEEWKAFADYDPTTGIILTTNEMQISNSITVETDSIFLSDTTSITDAIDQPWPNYGDTILFNADTVIFNDTLWIQRLYIYSDTLEFNSDTVYTQKSQAYKSLLLNTISGELYDIGEYFSREGSSDRLVYNKATNSFFFKNMSANEICEVDLGDISLKKHTLFYRDWGDNIWGIVQDMLFYSSRSQFPYLFCYNPGAGLITSTNIRYEQECPVISTFKLNDRIYCWVKYDVEGNVMLSNLEIRNDSMIFNKISTSIDSRGFTSVDNGELANIKYRNIFNDDEEWFHAGTYLWHFNIANSSFIILDISTSGITSTSKMVSDQSGNLFALSINKIIKIDLDALDIVELNEFSDIEIKRITIGYQSNIFIEGLRFSDLNDVVRELDTETGEILDEWVSENAPPETSISYLTKISNNK